MCKIKLRLGEEVVHITGAGWSGFRNISLKSLRPNQNSGFYSLSTPTVNHQGFQGENDPMFALTLTSMNL
jgi:hypothetical protein